MDENKFLGGRRPPSLEAYSVKKLIGKGGFAEVYLAVEKETQSFVAIKCIAKTRILRPTNEGEDDFAKTSSQEDKERQRVAAVLLERNILCSSDSPFLIRALSCFQTPTHLFIVMPYFGGGDLHRYLNVVGVMDEDMCRFVIVETILALEELHSQHIIYRDLKPGNLLFDLHGHLRLCDYGLCKKLLETDNFLTTGRAGTRGFRAPEVVRKEPYGYSCDFFSLGVSMYQLLTGKKMFGKSGISFRPVCNFVGLTQEAVLLIQELTQVKIHERLGCKPGQMGWDYVKKHSFFLNIDWDQASRKCLKSPYQPSPLYYPHPTKFKKNKHDRKNLDRNVMLSSQQQLLFSNFDWQPPVIAKGESLLPFSSFTSSSSSAFVTSPSSSSSCHSAFTSSVPSDTTTTTMTGRKALRHDNNTIASGPQKTSRTTTTTAIGTTFFHQGPRITPTSRSVLSSRKNLPSSQTQETSPDISLTLLTTSSSTHSSLSPSVSSTTTASAQTPLRSPSTNTGSSRVNSLVIQDNIAPITKLKLLFCSKHLPTPTVASSTLDSPVKRVSPRKAARGQKSGTRFKVHVSGNPSPLSHSDSWDSSSSSDSFVPALAFDP